MAEITFIKTEREPKLAALFKIDSKHFTIVEGNITESTICNRRHAQITGQEFAIFKPKLRKVGTGKVTLFKRAVFIVPFWQRMASIIF